MRPRCLLRRMSLQSSAMIDLPTRSVIVGGLEQARLGNGPDGQLSDMENRTWAKVAAVLIAVAGLNAQE
jgi:hypothetical protein